LWSLDVGVAHPATGITFAASADNAPPAWFGPPFDPSVALGVFQPAICTAVFSAMPPSLPGGILPPVLSFARGVGHPKQSLSDMGRARARSAQIGGPDCISQCFQVSTYSSEPFTSILARNLLSKDDWRAVLLDEVSEDWPEVSFIVFSPSLAGVRERLAW